MTSAQGPRPARPEDSGGRRSFWEGVHEGKAVDEVSWWQPDPELSLDLIGRACLGPDAPIIDVGAGWSTLVDHLLARGFRDLTAVDLSATALRTVRERLGEAGAQVVLTEADVLDLRPTRRYALWHDRAVFHFLTRPGERAAYRASLDRTLTGDGWVVLATFGPDGPATCSGLPVMRYGAAELAAEFPDHQVLATGDEQHRTPWGSTQQFTGVLLRRRPD